MIWDGGETRRPEDEEAEQLGLFGDLPRPDVPTEFQKIYVHFETLEDLRAFGDLVGIKGISTAYKHMTWPLQSFGGGTAVPEAPPPEPSIDFDELLADADQFEYDDASEREVSELVKRLARALRQARGGAES